MYRGDAQDGTAQPTEQDADDTRNAQRRQLQVRRAAAGILALGGVTVAASALFGAPHANTPASPNPGQLAAQVNAALHAAHLSALHAAQHGALVEVDGFVADAAQDLAARGVLLKFDNARIARHYDVEQTDLASIEESLASDGVQVIWREPGVLGVTGEVPSLARFRDQIDRVQTDLDSNVRRIEIDVAQRANQLPVTPYTEVMAAGDTRYVQTPDGVKHLFDDSVPADDGPTRLRETIVPAHASTLASDASDPPAQQP
jgi:type III secretion protein D